MNDRDLISLYGGTGGVQDNVAEDPLCGRLLILLQLRALSEPLWLRNLPERA
jgi:hypothetical protein